MTLRSNSDSDFRLQECVVYNIIRLLRAIVKARLILGLTTKSPFLFIAIATVIFFCKE